MVDGVTGASSRNARSADEQTLELEQHGPSEPRRLLTPNI
jgi:hypothetical protein